ncbi:hypothetical protein [Myroides odoratimimus]|uniref:hypothetical protein n=1 Tax=Myroides odoratimimus TaxID=76832 RepID=UPI0031010F3D
MKKYNLWEKLPNHKNQSFIEDVKEGKVPNLPFYIIDQDQVKSKIKEKIDAIKNQRLQTSFLTANYGNGKTNILKYLELFYKQEDADIKVLYYRADVDNFDIINNLLRIIEDHFTNDLITAIKDYKASKLDVALLINNYEGNFSAIKEYTEKLFDVSEENSIKHLIYLGTGRLNSKRYFDKENIRQLRDYERREILVLFLNLLVTKNKYVIFCIDEVEKIHDKSKARFSHFLTSLRELIDLSNKIKGHYLILAMTDKTDVNLIQSTNEALHSRIHRDIIAIQPIEDINDKKELINYLKELFDKSEISTDEIFNKISKSENINSNRTLIQKIAEILFSQESQLNLSEGLEKFRLLELFSETKYDLEVNIEAFKNIHRKFFDPLEYYLESFNTPLKENDDEYFKSQLRYYYNLDQENLVYFIFNEDISLINSEMMKIKGIVDALELDKNKNVNKITLFVPSQMELNYSILSINENEKTKRIKIVDIDSYQDLFTLLVMFRENFDKQSDLKVLIENYTNSNL